MSKKKKTSVGSWIAAVVVVLALVVAGVYLARKAMHPDTQKPTSPAAPASAATVAAAPAIEHPIAQASTPASASTAALPALDSSDAQVASAFAALAGGGDVRGLLVSQRIIQRIVTTIDALPRHGLAVFMLPLHTPKGAFVSADANGTTIIGEQNAARYAPYMQLVENADPKTVVDWYVHAYPLFQQAYRELGYPKGYFNDRLIVVIDSLLAAPEPIESPALATSKTYLVYVDPALESLPAGQKLLVRVGHANEMKIKAKLRAIRAQLTGQRIPAGAAANGAAAPATSR